MRLWPWAAWALVLLWLGVRAASDDAVPYAGQWAPYVAMAVAVLTLVTCSTVWMIRLIEARLDRRGNTARALGDHLVWIFPAAGPRGSAE